MYSKRIQKLCGELTKTNVFADVGCDHGFCSEYMLKNDLCNLAIISDISKDSLKKAEKLLKKEIEDGKCKSVCSDGLRNINEKIDLVLIAGMGGVEILKILQESYIPSSFVFQPMKNSQELRRYLVENNCSITKDYTFCDDKFYDVIVGKNDGLHSQNYSNIEYEFGKTNIQNPSNEFIEKIKANIEKYKRYLKGNVSAETKKELEEYLQKLEEVLNGKRK